MATQKIVFEGLVTQGTFPPMTRDSIKALMRRMEGKRLRVAFDEAKNKRTIKQNAFYFGVIIPMVQELFESGGANIDAEQCHEYLKKHVMGITEVITDPAGIQHIVAGRSRDKDTVKWEENMQKIRAWAAQFNVQIPFPNEHLQQKH